MGDLQGNRFHVVLRDLVADSDESIENALSKIKKNGFLNYFGLQRFGTSDVPTHVVGLAILREDWQEAIDLLLKPRPNGIIF